MKSFLKGLSFLTICTLMLCSLFSVLRFIGMSMVIDIPNGKDFLTDIKINLVISFIIAIYVVIKECDKGSFM